MEYTLFEPKREVQYRKMRYQAINALFNCGELFVRLLEGCFGSGK